MKLSKTQRDLLEVASRHAPFGTVNTRNLRAGFALEKRGLLKHIGAGRHPADATFQITDAGRSALGVMAAPASLEIIGWQWRRIGQPWPEKLLNFEPSVTTADSEKRAIYAGPTITYGVPEVDRG